MQSKLASKILLGDVANVGVDALSMGISVNCLI